MKEETKIFKDLATGKFIGDFRLFINQCCPIA